MISGIGNDYNIPSIVSLHKSEGIGSSGMSNDQDSQQQQSQAGAAYINHIGENKELNKIVQIAHEQERNKYVSARINKVDTGDKISLSPEAEKEVQELRQRDLEVKAHEQKHIAAGGAHVSGSPNYTYTKGPDNRQYATAGSVSLDTSSISGDPEATIEKAATLRKAALAPSDPSAQDQRVAASAAAMETEAKAALRELEASENKGNEIGNSSSFPTQAHGGIGGSLNIDSSNTSSSEGYINSNLMDKKPSANSVAAMYQHTQEKDSMTDSVVPWGTNINMFI